MNGSPIGTPNVGADQPENADETGDGEARHHGVAHVLLAGPCRHRTGERRDGHQHTSATEVIIQAVSLRSACNLPSVWVAKRAASLPPRRRCGLLGRMSVDHRHAQDRAKRTPTREPTAPHGLVLDVKANSCRLCGSKELRCRSRRADAHGGVECEHKDFSVSDLTGLGRPW